MKLKKFMIFFISLFIFICSCTGNPISEQNNNISNQDKTDLSSENKEQHSLADNISIYTINSDISNANQYLSIEKLEIPAELNDYKVACTEIYNENNLIILLYEEKYTATVKEIGMYNFESSKYTPLLELEENLLFEIKTLNEKYMIMSMSTNEWKTSSLYYYDFGNKSLIKFFDHSIDPTTQRVFYDNYNDILLCGDKVYFDDFCLDKDNNLSVLLYVYDISKNTVELVANNLQNPFTYNNEVIAFAKNRQGKYKSLKSILTDYEYLEIKDDIRDITSTTDNIFCIVNSYTNHEERYTIFQVKNVTKNQVLFSTRSPIDSLDCSEHFLVWKNYDDEYPCIYDLHTEQFLLFTDIPRGVNVYRLKDDYGILLNVTDKKINVYLFKRKKTNY